MTVADLKEQERGIKIDVFDILNKQGVLKAQYDQLEKDKREKLGALQGVQKQIGDLQQAVK